MKDRGPINEELVERVAVEIRGQRLDDDTVHQATDRVWQRLQDEVSERRPLSSCEDFQAEIPALVAGTLPEARALLVADHTRECVPCRRVLMEARGQSSEAAGPVHGDLGATRRRNRILLRVAAALLAITGGVIGVRMVGTLMANKELRASVQAVDGSLQLVEQNEVRELGTGSFVLAHQVVRTKKGSGAFLRLGDGSLIEMDERSELALKASQRGTTIDLRRGNIIVHAADQHGGRLFVGTGDCTIAVKGTIFAVDHGLKGSRVSVIEGEVEVVQGSRTSVLEPGDQLSTDARLRPVPLEDEFSWSRDAEKHRELVRALRGLRRAVADAIDTAPPRSSTRLLDLAPGDTLIYAAIPNLTADLDAARGALAEHLAASSALSEWWQTNVVSTGVEREIDEVLDRLQPIGQAIGDELVVAVPRSSIEAGTGPLFLAVLDDPTTFQGLLEAEIERANAEEGGQPAVVLLSDPLPAEPPSAEVLLWIHDDVFAATSDLDSLRTLAIRLQQPAARDFVGTDLHDRLATEYAEGVSWLFGVDLAAAMDSAFADQPPEEVETLRSLGLLDATTLVLERHRDGTWYATNAEVQFDGPRRGVMAWLAAPAPMGSLEFVSPDAYLAASAVTSDGARMFDDILAVLAERDPRAVFVLQLVENRLGIDLRDDFFATLGGEGAVALDGPVLPQPSWKVILEVYDPDTLVHALAQVVTEVNVELAAAGKPGLVLNSDDAAGRVYFTLGMQGEDFQVVFTAVDGYLVFAPSRALIEQAIDFRASGVNLPSSAAFRALLPESDFTNCSAIIYRDLETLENAIPQEMWETAGIAEALTDGLSKGLLCVFAEDDRLQLSTTGGSLLGMSSLLALPGAAAEEMKSRADQPTAEPVSSTE